MGKGGPRMAQTAIEAAEATRPPLLGREILERVLAVALVSLVVIWLTYHLVDDPALFIAVLLAGVNNGALYALIALGYTLVYGIIELINFSHGDLFMLSTVLAATLLVSLLHATSLNVSSLLLMLAVLPFVMAGAAGVNMAAERVAYRRLRRAPKLAPLITAVGLSFLYQEVGLKTNGSTAKPWDRIFGNEGFDVGPIHVTWSFLVVLGCTIPLLLLLTWVVQRTRQGMAMRATAQDQDAARLMGINVDQTIAFTFALGGAMAGAAGLLYLESVGTTNYNLGFQLGLYAFTAAVLGGIGNLNGAVLGGFLIGLIEGFNGGIGIGPRWNATVIFTLLIMVMVFRPEGILGRRTTEKV